MTASQQVHLRFNDSATAQPTAVRLRVTDAEGRYHAPYGRRVQFALEPGVDVGANVSLNDEAWAIIDGACEITLPPGPLRIQARKGPEYRPLDVEVELLAGKMSLRFAMERWTNLASLGWFAGDSCAFEMSPHAALLEAMVEDLAVVDLLVRERDGTLANILAYSGQQPALARPGHMVVVNTANQSPECRLLLLNTHRVVYPLSFQRGEKWSLIDWCDQCHRKKGLVVADDWLLHGQPSGDDFLGRVDAVRFHPGVSLEPYFTALNRGRRLSLVGGSGKESNRIRLGEWRTYAHVGQSPFDYAAWTEAIRAGRTFVTNGPIVLFDGRVAEAWGADRIQIIADGQVIAETTESRLECEPTGRWMLARCESPNGGLAITSPRFAE